MRKLISDVAEIIRDFETLNLIQKTSISTIMVLNEDKELILDVTFIVNKFACEICIEMLKQLKSQHNASVNISVQELAGLTNKITASFY